MPGSVEALLQLDLDDDAGPSLFDKDLKCKANVSASA